MTVLLTAEVAVEGLVQPLSLTLQAGRPLTILGETGSGKSLLAQAILGTLPKGLQARGTARIGETVLDLARPQRHRALWGRVISVLPQEPWLSLDPLMRARAQVAEGHALVRGDRDADARADADLAELGLTHAADRRPWELSGGMAQRVAFAAARAGGARIVVADEPTKGLDAARRDEVGDLLMREVADGGGLLTITHDLALARRIGGDMIVLREGRVVERGEAERVLTAPSDPYTARLIAADPARWPRRPAHDIGASVLRGTDLAIRRGGADLFRDLSLDVRAGEVLGISGPSGCGKSTLGDILLGLASPDAGWVERTGDRLRFQKLYQDPVAAFPRTVTLRHIFNDLIRRHGLDGTRLPPLMNRMRLSPALLDRRATEVSGGELQRLALVRVLLLDPVLLFADEPTSRLDPLTQQEVIGQMCDVARDRGMTLVIVSHDDALLDRISDRRMRLG